MPTFINLALDGKVPTNFLAKHILFSLCWLVGFALLIFRVDDLILPNDLGIQWIKTSLPVFYVISLLILIIFQKWYWSIMLLAYPAFMMFWFVPKVILVHGKIYLLGNYISTLANAALHFRKSILKICVFLLVFILLLTIRADWTRWLTIGWCLAFYVVYVRKLLDRSFRKPALWGDGFERQVKQLLDRSASESLVVKSFIEIKDDKPLEEIERQQKHMWRLVMAKQVIDLLSERINGFKGRRAFLISWIYGAFIFLVISIIIFWIINLQLYLINGEHYKYSGGDLHFDFLYYTWKTITFGDIDIVKPVSITARVIEFASFFSMGIFLLVIVVSIVLSLQQEQMKENVKLATELFEKENAQLIAYSKSQFGKDINTLATEFQNIEQSLQKVKKFFEQFF